MLKTFNQILATHTDTQVFPESDTILNQAIKDWYGSRYVGTESEDDFIRFFRRAYKKDYARYVQLLRIEPGVSEYDWLVQEYKERQTTLDEAMNNSSTTTTTATGSVTGGEEKTASGTKGNVRTLNTEEAIEATKNGTSSNEVTKVTDNDRAISDTIQRTDNLSQATNNNYKNYEMDQATQQAMAKSQPMSVAYTDGNGNPDNPISSSVITVTQGQSSEKERMYSIGSMDPDSQNPGILDFSYADSQTMGDNRTYNRHFGKDDSTTTNTGTQTNTRTGSDTTDETVTTNQSGESTEASGSQKTNTGTVTDAGTSSESVEISITKSSSESKSDATTGGHEKETLEREIYTGRHKEIAELLSRAATYITNTNAFEWFMEQIDVCFYGIYEV